MVIPTVIRTWQRTTIFPEEVAIIPPIYGFWEHPRTLIEAELVVLDDVAHISL